MGPTSVERGHETRTRLLQAAEQLIVEIGWGSVTTRKVAERAGVRPGLVHYHFQTVTDLLVDASMAAARRELGASITLLSEASDADAGLEATLRMMSEYSTRDPTTLLMSEMYLAATRIDRLREEMRELLSEWRGAATEWLRKHRVPDPEGTAVLLGGALEGLILHSLIDPRLAEVPINGPLQRLMSRAGGTDDAEGTGAGNG